MRDEQHDNRTHDVREVRGLDAVQPAPRTVAHSGRRHLILASVSSSSDAGAPSARLGGIADGAPSLSRRPRHTMSCCPGCLTWTKHLVVGETPIVITLCCCNCGRTRVLRRWGRA